MIIAVLVAIIFGIGFYNRMLILEILLPLLITPLIGALKKANDDVLFGRTVRRRNAMAAGNGLVTAEMADQYCQCALETLKETQSQAKTVRVCSEATQCIAVQGDQAIFRGDPDNPEPAQSSDESLPARYPRLQIK